ncbi:helix-turn-helix transcriptional regulator [Candidatus Uhrbacteria bacterium]|nr:helix-turn-helix transcriptional regulator [Candidatus Uhrbacteria bacterium]
MSKSGFKLEQMFGSKTRARLMGLFLQHSKEAFFVRELTRRIDAQLNSVRRELKNLIEMGLIVEKHSESRRTGKSLAEKKKYYTANESFILFEDLHALFQKVHILLKQNFVQEIGETGDIQYFAFTGRFVDAPSVPTDLLIVGSIKQASLEKLIAKFESEFSYEINYTLMPKEEFLDRKQVSDRFLFSILNADKIVMINKLGV